MKDENQEKGSYNINHIDEASPTVTYLCKEDGYGRWYFKKVDETSNPTVFGHASKKNNSDYEKYAEAYTDRASLNYGTKDEAI